MITQNVSTLKIHKLTQEQYDRELAAGNIDKNAIYLPPDGDLIETRKYIDSLSWNDIATSSKFVSDGLNHGGYYKVNDCTPTLEDINSGGEISFLVVQSGKVTTESYSENKDGLWSVTSNNNGSICITNDGAPLVIVAKEVNPKFGSLTIEAPEEGLYFCQNQYWIVQSLVLNVECVHNIPMDYMPNEVATLPSYVNQLSEEIADLKENGTGGGATEEQLAQLERNPLYGKKVSFLGDSICAGADTTTSYLGGYGRIIAERNNMIYENMGAGGATVTAETYTSTGGDAKVWLCRRIENMSADADYAIIEGGLNDAFQFNTHGTIEIGEISEGYDAQLDDTTYYGAFESMLKQLVTRFKGKKIGYIAVPKLHELYDSNINAPNFYHIALECCAKWGVPVCDLNIIVPTHRYIGAIHDIYGPDGTHPNEEGYRKYYADPIEAWMKTLTTGGNSITSMTKQAVDYYTQGFNDAIKALQEGKLDKAGISFKKALLPLADGTTLEIDVLTSLNGTVVVPFINQVPISIDTNGSVFNGKGYIENKRLSSSGAMKDLDRSITTGFMPAKGGDVIRIFHCDFATNAHASNYICAYDSNFALVGGLATRNGYDNLTVYSTDINGGYTFDTDKNVTLTLNAVANIAYIRVSSAGASVSAVDGLTFDPEDMIITVNEEIS